MRDKAIALGLGAATLLLVELASAAGPEEFGRQGTAALFGERLFGIHSSRVSDRGVEWANTQNSDTTGISLGWRGQRAATPFDVPRLAFDYFVIDSLSVGAGGGYASYGDDVDDEELLLAPRVGYALMFSKLIGFWLRSGVTYHSTKRAEKGWAFTAEGLFIVAPTPHFGILLGPTFDVDFATDDAHFNRRYRAVALNVGIGGWF